ncbi:hypothetical protein KI387_041566, partial [Taxus chinensis]
NKARVMSITALVRIQVWDSPFHIIITPISEGRMTWKAPIVMASLLKPSRRLSPRTHIHDFLKMGGQLKHIEPASCTGLQEDHDVWRIIRENGIMTFLERMSGYSALVSYGALATWSRGRVQIGNTRFTISTNAIASVTSLPSSGVVYFKKPL